MNRGSVLTLASLSILVTASFLLGSGMGAIPGEFSMAGQMPNNLNVGFPSCGSCHNLNPNASVKVAIAMSTSINAGANVPVSVAISGANTTSTSGGFSLETDRGTLVAGTTTRVATTPSLRSAITHRSSAARTWSFQFTPPATPGLVRMFSTGNCVDGDAQNTGDEWGWYGPDATTPGTPFRVFVNDSQVFAFGSSCAGSRGFEPVLGIAKNAAVNGTFDTEVYNVPPQAATVGILGLSNTTYGPLPLPFDLGILGAPGCALRVSMDVMQAAVTTGSGPGNGVGRHTWGIPNIASLRGLSLYFQAMTLDAVNRLGLTFSMGLRAVIQ